jgi:hypothetical protein
VLRSRPLEPLLCDGRADAELLRPGATGLRRTDWLRARARASACSCADGSEREDREARGVNDALLPPPPPEEACCDGAPPSLAADERRDCARARSRARLCSRADGSPRCARGVKLLLLLLLLEPLPLPPLLRDACAGAAELRLTVTGLRRRADALRARASACCCAVGSPRPRSNDGGARLRELARAGSPDVDDPWPVCCGTAWLTALTKSRGAMPPRPPARDLSLTMT